MRMIVLAAMLAIAGCATSPEGKLKQGYDTSSRVVNTAVILLDRDVITPEDGERVLQAGIVSKSALDAGKDALIRCRAADPNDKCDGAANNIDLGAGMLLQLEEFLERAEQ